MMNINNKDSNDIEIILDEEEFDWLYTGNFSADLEEPWGNEVADPIIQKLRDAWETGKDGKFKLILSKEEVDFIDELIRDMLFEDFDPRDPDDEGFKGMMEVTNSILKKLGTTLTIENIIEEYKSLCEEDKLIEKSKRFNHKLKETDFLLIDMLEIMVNQAIRITIALSYDNNEFGTHFNLNIKDLNEIRENYEEIDFSQFKKLLNYSETIYSYPIIDVKEQEIEIKFNKSIIKLTGISVVFLKSTGSILQYRSLIKKLLTDDVYKSFIINEMIKKSCDRMGTINPNMIACYIQEANRLTDINPWTDFQKYKFCKIFYDDCREEGMTHQEALQKTINDLPYKKQILLRYLSIFELPLPVQLLMKEEIYLTEDEIKELRKYDLNIRHKKLGIKVAHAMALKLKGFTKDKICKIAIKILLLSRSR